MEIKSNKFGKYQCPCCAYFTYDESPHRGYDICDVCFWEADPIQFDDPNYEGGANIVSLIQARENFKKYGACDERAIEFVRPPAFNEFDLT